MPTPASRRRALARTLGPLIGLAAVWTLFAFLRPAEFIAWDNQRVMLLQTAVVGAAAIGATMIIISGGLDLSVGSSIALGTVVVALLLKSGVHPTLAAIGGITAGMATGVAIGSMVVGYVGRVASVCVGALVAVLTWSKWGGAGAIAASVVATSVALLLTEVFLPRVTLSPFIVTLGMWGGLRGLAKGLGHNEPVYPESAGWLKSLMDISGETKSLPVGVWATIGLAVVMTLVLRSTPLGLQIFAIGSNETAARSCGIRVDRVKILVYMLGVACAGLAAILQFSYLSMGDPTTADGYELKVIAAVVIGGASLSGGEGSIRGTLAGALIMTVVDNGCAKLDIPNWVQEIVTGAIIVTAVVLDRLRQRTR